MRTLTIPNQIEERYVRPECCIKHDVGTFAQCARYERRRMRADAKGYPTLPKLKEKKS